MNFQSADFWLRKAKTQEILCVFPSILTQRKRKSASKNRVRITHFRVVIGDSNGFRLILDKFECFQFVVLERRQPIFVLRIKIILNFSAYKVGEFKKKKFWCKTKKIQE